MSDDVKELLAKHEQFGRSVKEHYIALARLLKHALTSVESSIEAFDNPEALSMPKDDADES